MPTDKLPLRINLDDTSVYLDQGDGKGTVFIDKKRGSPTQNVIHEHARSLSLSLSLYIYTHR